ncbi:hypothetical protein ACIQAC_14630 [Streptomyces sp. NPDC088387]|uniref:hypothetical protein n=1 Tax=Streptomyces sp. NPDC088387 TaxID=3365859 RepID=UPI00381048D9
MTRTTATKKSLAAVLLAAALTATPTTAHAVASHPAPPTTHTQTQTPSTEVRVVAPGEQVVAGAGVELWLTGEGKHWSTPEMDHQFRSVTDGNIDLNTPGIGVTMETLGDRYFLSGIYVTGQKAVRVVVNTSDGRVTASAIRLPGNPGWGVWYTDVPLHDTLTINKITLYDRQGNKITTFTPSHP